MSESVSEKLGSIKTEILIAWIFSLLTLIAWIGLFLFYFIYFFIVLGLFVPYGGIFVGIGLAYGIIFFIFMIPTILVFRRVSRMRNAANRGDINGLKSLNSLGWAIVALIFSGIIPGIMLLIVHSPIQELSTRTMSTGGTSMEDLERLAKLKSLLDQGVITKDEFEAQKNRIMNPSSARSSGSLETQLARLKSLYDSGAITEEEYNSQKKKLLSGI